MSSISYSESIDCVRVLEIVLLSMSGRDYRSLTARMFAEAVRMSITNVVIKEEGKAHNFQCSSRPDSLKPILPCAVYRDTPMANVRIENPTTSKKMNIPRASSAAFLTINPFSSTLSFFCWLLLAECHIFHLCYLVYLVRWVHDLRFSVATRSDFYQTKTGIYEHELRTLSYSLS